MSTTTSKLLISSPLGQPSLISTKSAAPSIKEFKPPVPTPNDEYPGYYRTPEGEWAMHEPDYYWSVASAWQERPSVKEEIQRPGPSERKRKQWEGDEEDFQQVNAIDEASRTRAEIETAKSLTADAIRTGPTAPNMKMTVCVLSFAWPKLANPSLSIGRQIIKQSEVKASTFHSLDRCVQPPGRN